MATNHECAGCGGKGATFVVKTGGWKRCPVCLGSGRISDVISTVDQKADEETASVNGIA
jgi:DnaJ-class molecular chaperone